MIVAVPVIAPVTTPTEVTVALLELLLHVPPATASVKAVVAPTQTLSDPVIAVGTA